MIKTHVKNILFNSVNAAVLPLVILTVSIRNSSADLFDLPVIAQIFACPESIAMTVIIAFALGYSLLNHLRWPVIIAAYVAGGLVAVQVNARFLDNCFVFPAEAATYALIGFTLIVAFRAKIHLIFARKITWPVLILLPLLVVLDFAFLLINERYFPGVALEWRVNLALLATGALIGIVMAGLFLLLKRILKKPDALLDRMVYRKAAADPQDPKPETPSRKKNAFAEQSDIVNPFAEQTEIVTPFAEQPEVKKSVAKQPKVKKIKVKKPLRDQAKVKQPKVKQPKVKKIKVKKPVRDQAKAEAPEVKPVDEPLDVISFLDKQPEVVKPAAKKLVQDQTPRPPPPSTTNKLLSQTDLPKIKTANNERGRPASAVERPASVDRPKPAESVISDEDWLKKHLSSLE